MYPWQQLQAPQNHRIIGLERTIKDCLVQPPCYGQGHTYAHGEKHRCVWIYRYNRNKRGDIMISLINVSQFSPE